jgi:hypothetical protein
VVHAASGAGRLETEKLALGRLALMTETVCLEVMTVTVAKVPTALLVDAAAEVLIASDLNDIVYLYRSQ